MEGTNERMNKGRKEETKKRRKEWRKNEGRKKKVRIWKWVNELEGERQDKKELNQKYFFKKWSWDGEKDWKIYKKGLKKRIKETDKKSLLVVVVSNVFASVFSGHQSRDYDCALAEPPSVKRPCACPVPLCCLPTMLLHTQPSHSCALNQSPSCGNSEIRNDKKCNI